MNPIYSERPLGMEISTNLLLTTTEQYSRSPSRAKRRMKRGFRQHFRTAPDKKLYIIDNKIICHPAILKELQTSFNNVMQRANECTFDELINGKPERYEYANTVEVASRNTLTPEKLQEMMQHIKDLALPGAYPSFLKQSAMEIVPSRKFLWNTSITS